VAHLDSHARLRRLTTCAMMAAVLGVLSLIALPLPISPVPVTLQTLGVLLAGGILGPWWGAVSVLLYIGLGVVGAPVFAGGEAGMGVLVGPRAGYLIGFVAAACVMGLCARRQTIPLALGTAAASLSVYAFGAPWLGWVTGMGVKNAVIVGVLPYVPGDVLKCAAAVALLSAVRPALRKAGLEHMGGARG